MSQARTTDLVTRFLLPDAGVRGVHVDLSDAWQTLRQRSGDVAELTALLGQASAAAVLLGAHAKVQGRLSVQLHGQGSVRTVFAESTAAGGVRGIVQLAEDADRDQAAAIANDLTQMGEGAMLAMTVENPGLREGEPQRYQGLVPLEAARLDAAFEDYFIRSEQLPTRLLLAANDAHAVGLMLQKLPGDEGDADGWNRIASLFATLAQDELLSTDASMLIHRLFHEERPEWLDSRELAFACSCSAERVADMLRALGHAEASAAAQDGPAEIRCEFCGAQYRFDSEAIDQLFTDAVVQSPSPNQLH